jgi:ornithine carbamoyltransferase
MSLSRKDFLSLRDFPREELETILRVAAEQKPLARRFRLPSTHAGRALACIFHKPSLRTRLSFEVAMRQLGGSSLYITEREIGIGSREAPRDVAKVLSRFVDGIMIRTFEQRLIEDLAGHAEVPVINGLTDLLHPCQVLGDIFTAIEKLGSIDGKKVVFVGDGNNVARSWLNAASRFTFSLVLAAPRGYEIEGSFVEGARAAGDLAYSWIPDPREAVQGADIVYTDVWTSMGRRPGGYLHALSAGAPGRRGDRFGDRRSALGRLRRGGKPAARSEGHSLPPYPRGVTVNLATNRRSRVTLSNARL